MYLAIETDNVVPYFFARSKIPIDPVTLSSDNLAILLPADLVFNGEVREVRLNPKTVSNVVNYTVVIDAY